MLYLVVFASLALGVYAQTNIGAQLAANERRCNESMLAADSGLAFMRYQLANLAIPPGLTPDQKWE